MQAMAQVWAHPEDLPLYPVSFRHCSMATRAALGLGLPLILLKDLSQLIV